MQTNFLEELVAEWLEYKGYFVKRNERVGRLPRGGHEMELDIVAFNPEKNHLVHYETSTDGNSWFQREERFSKKFASGKRHIASLFKGLNTPGEPDKFAMFAIVSSEKHKTVGGGKVVSARDFITMVLRDLKGTPFLSHAVPEKYPILRVLQMIAGQLEQFAEELNQDACEPELER